MCRSAPPVLPIWSSSGLLGGVDDRAFGAVDFARVLAAVTFAAAGGELGAFEDAGRALVSYSARIATQSSSVRRVARRAVDERLQVGHESGDRADEEVAVVDAVARACRPARRCRQASSPAASRGFARPSPEAAGAEVVGAVRCRRF